MNKKIVVLGLLGAFFASSCQATEMRTPWILDRGPLRYTFEKLHNDKYNLSTWTAGHYKYSNKAFLAHGTKTHPLTALIFNKADFLLGDIFPDSQVPLNSENYSPFLKLSQMHPRAKYTEWGLTFGGRWDYPVWENKGRIGLRATVPFRTIDFEREDVTDKNSDPQRDYVKTKIIAVNRNNDGADPGAKADIACTAYRLDYVNGLVSSDHQAAFFGANNSVKIFGQNGNEIAVADNVKAIGDNTGARVTVAASTDPSRVNDASYVNEPIFYAWMRASKNAADLTSISKSHIYAADDATAANLIKVPTDLDPTTLAAVAGDVGNVGYFSITNNDYSQLNNLGTNATLDKNASALWIIFRRGQDSNDQLQKMTPDNTNNMSNNIQNEIIKRGQQYNENPLLFMMKRGYEFESRQRTGLGDIDLDLFYEHTFNKDWMGELCVGVRFPTGGTDDLWGNPYIANPGNGDHWEIKLGGLMAYQPISWMNMKLDLSYNFVLEGTEHRTAAFKGAKIKNIGPRADADVDWGYLIGHFDFNFFHPKTSDIRSTLGYEIYYKTEDHISFKKSVMESWLGKKWVQETPVAVPPQYILQANDKDLSDGLARKNTESVAHKVRFEMSYQVSKYFELFSGATYTFAGQNVMRDRDASLGCNVRF